MTIKEFKKLKVGDKVRIKTLQELKEEFGESEYSISGIAGIASKITFVPSMFKTAGSIVPIVYKDEVSICIEKDMSYYYSYDVIKEKVEE